MRVIAICGTTSEGHVFRSDFREHPAFERAGKPTAVRHERCSTRNHENATADPSAAPQDDSANGDDATYLPGSGLYRAVAMGEFSGQVLRLRWARAGEPNFALTTANVVIHRMTSQIGRASCRE